MRLALLLFLLLLPPVAGAQLRLGDYSAPTPQSIPGADLIATAELRRLLQAPPGVRPIVFDVRGERRPSIPAAIWLPGAGRGTSFEDAVQMRLAEVLYEATHGDRSRTVVFFCAGPRCWLSYNAALRAVQLGYTDVRWYREGTSAWGSSGGVLIEPLLTWQRP